jgi:hypothetical protein
MRSPQDGWCAGGEKISGRTCRVYADPEEAYEIGFLRTPKIFARKVANASDMFTRRS